MLSASLFKPTLSWLAHGDYLHFKLWFNVNVHHMLLYICQKIRKIIIGLLWFHVPFLSRKTGLCRTNCLILFSLSKLFQLFYSYKNWMVQFVHNIWQRNKKGFIKKLLKQWLVLEMTLEHMITALSEEIMTKIPHLTERWIIVNAGFIHNHNGFSLLLMQFCYCFSFCLLILLWKNIKVHHVRSVFVLKGHSVKNLSFWYWKLSMFRKKQRFMLFVFKKKKKDIFWVSFKIHMSKQIITNVS